ncbi:MAG: hypothetical protein BGO98_19325 [Myxococcales bacterium 68-20]|nr:MAG: hypothetical protein BGO98_19325 [Myxococcales bacterium 68-20]
MGVRVLVVGLRLAPLFRVSSSVFVGGGIGGLFRRLFLLLGLPLLLRLIRVLVFGFLLRLVGLLLVREGTSRRVDPSLGVRSGSDAPAKHEPHSESEARHCHGLEREHVPLPPSRRPLSASPKPHA